MIDKIKGSGNGPIHPLRAELEQVRGSRAGLRDFSQQKIAPIIEGKVPVDAVTHREALMLQLQINKFLRDPGIPEQLVSAPIPQPVPVALPAQPTPPAISHAPAEAELSSGRPTVISQADPILQSAAKLAAATTPKLSPAAGPKPAASTPKPVAAPLPAPQPAPQLDAEKTRTANVPDIKIQELTAQIKKLEGELKTATDNYKGLNERHNRLTEALTSNTTELNKRQQTIEKAKKDAAALQKELKDLRETKERADKALQTAREELRDLKAAQTSAIAQAKLVAYNEGLAIAQKDFGKALLVINSELADPEKLLAALKTVQVGTNNEDLARLVTFLKLMASEKLG